MKSTATAPASIAFIKYWGKKDEKLRLPETSSISINLDKCLTHTTVEFSPNYKQDTFEILGNQTTEEEKERVYKHLNRIRALKRSSFYAKVVSQNTFPKGSGIASSGSGFAALTVAASSSLGLKLSEKELSILARLGSGSACRSVPGGFVQWKEGNTSNESYAYSMYPPGYWEIVDILAIVSDKVKKTSSTIGHALATKTSIFHKPRVEEVRKLISHIKTAIRNKDLTLAGEILEKDCIYMHSVMMTSKPALFYWSGKTMDVIHKVHALRANKIPAFFTIDAGPNVHIITEAKYTSQVVSELKKIPGIKDIIINKTCRGAYLTNKHLF